MKDVLVTGGAGKIGFDLVKKLIDETNSNITVLDLESKASIKTLSKVERRVRVVYGDVEDANLIRDLVKRNDIVIDYAGIMPPLADLNENIANSTNFVGTKNIVDAIAEVNPDCVYMYMSFIAVYGKTDKKVRKLSVDTESTHPDDYYSVSIIRSEEYIRSKIKNYTIMRMPIVLTRSNYFIKHIKLDRTMDFITKEDLNDIVVAVIKSPKIVGKTYNISGFKAKGRDVVKGLYKISGRINVFGRNLYYGEYEDTKEIDKLGKVKYTTLSEFVEDSMRKVPRRKRAIRKILNFWKYIIFMKMK